MQINIDKKIQILGDLDMRVSEISFTLNKFIML